VLVCLFNDGIDQSAPHFVQEVMTMTPSSIIQTNLYIFGNWPHPPQSKAPLTTLLTCRSDHGLRDVNFVNTQDAARGTSVSALVCRVRLHGFDIITAVIGFIGLGVYFARTLNVVTNLCTATTSSSANSPHAGRSFLV